VQKIPEEALGGQLWRYHWTAYDPGFSAWGHPQRNFGYTQAEGRFILTLDDDDTWGPNALDDIIGSVEDYLYNVHVFKMRYTDGHVLWSEPRMRLGNVGSPMIVVPNDRGKVGRWGSAYEGDYHFLVSTVANYGSEDCILWHDKVIAHIRLPGTA
jgi:glycosyltransferase involved in cell wall biosynthesis